MKPYQMSIPTGLTKSGVDVLATVDKACGSGSGGGDCIPIPCRVCIRLSLDFTFGGVLSSIGTITIADPYIQPGDFPYWQWSNPPPSQPTGGIETPCGLLRIFFQINNDGSVVLEIRLNGVLVMQRTGSMRVCSEYVPGDPTEFIYPQALVDGSAETGYGPGFTITGNAEGCNGDASIVVTNSGSGDGSGSTNPYDFAADTLLTKEGKRILAAVDCAAAGSGPNLYWYAGDTGIRKNNKRVFWAYNPCCNDPEFYVGIICDGAYSFYMKRTLYLTFIPNYDPFGPNPDTSTVTLTYSGYSETQHNYVWTGYIDAIPGYCDSRIYFRFKHMRCDTCRVTPSTAPSPQWFLQISEREPRDLEDYEVRNPGDINSYAEFQMCTLYWWNGSGDPVSFSTSLKRLSVAEYGVLTCGGSGISGDPPAAMVTE